MVCLQIVNIGHVPGLSHHLLSLRWNSDADYIYVGTFNGIQSSFKFGKTLFTPLFRKLNGVYAYRVDPLRSDDEQVRAVVAPEGIARPPMVETNLFHCAHGHSREMLLRKTDKLLAVQLTGQPIPCQGCSEAKQFRRSTKSVMPNRAVEPTARLFINLTGTKPVPSCGERKYTMIVRDDFSRYTEKWGGGGVLRSPR